MKVKEVIAALAKMPKNADVMFIADEESSTLVVAEAKVEATCNPGERVVRVYLREDEG